MEILVDEGPGQGGEAEAAAEAALAEEGPGQGGEGYEPDPETSGLPVPLPPPGKGAACQGRGQARNLTMAQIFVPRFHLFAWYLRFAFFGTSKPNDSYSVLTKMEIWGYPNGLKMVETKSFPFFIGKLHIVYMSIPTLALIKSSQILPWQLADWPRFNLPYDPAPVTVAEAQIKLKLWRA